MLYSKLNEAIALIKSCEAISFATEINCDIRK